MCIPQKKRRAANNARHECRAEPKDVKCSQTNSPSNHIFKCPRRAPKTHVCMSVDLSMRGNMRGKTCPYLPSYGRKQTQTSTDLYRYAYQTYMSREQYTISNMCYATNCDTHNNTNINNATATTATTAVTTATIASPTGTRWMLDCFFFFFLQKPHVSSLDTMCQQF